MKESLEQNNIQINNQANPPEDFGVEENINGDNEKNISSVENAADEARKNILKIEEELKSDPGLANKLFTEYKKVIDSSKKETEDLEKMYNETFFNKPIDQNKANNAILRNAFDLLKAAADRLENISNDEKKDLINGLIVSMRRQDKVQKQALHDLKKMAEKMNGHYEEINENYTEFLNEKEKNEIREKMAEDGESDEEIEEYLEYIDWEQNNEFNAAIYDTAEAYHEMLNKEDQNSRFDSNRIEKIITEMEEYYKKEPSEKVAEWLDVLRETIKFQEDLENKLDQFVYGDEKKESNDLVLNKYQEIIDEAKNIKENIKNFYKKEKDIDEDDVEQVLDTLLGRAKTLLDDYTEKLHSGTQIDMDEISSRLENQKTDAAVFASIFEAAYKKEKIAFDELRGVDYKTSSSIELSNDEKKMILDVVKLNYPDKEQQEDILQKIEESFKNEKTKWHLLTRQGEQEKSLVSCLRFDELDEESVYAATFNVGSVYRGSKLGDAMFDRVMIEVAQNKKIHAIAEMDKSVSDYYINKGGFNAKGIKINEKTKRKYYEIERFDPENEFYGTKRIANNQDLLAYYKEDANPEDLIRMQKYILVKKEDENKVFNRREIEYILNNGYLLTRTIKNEQIDGKNDSYLVFEKKALKAKDNQKQAA
jgi:hypothetical protein